MLRVLATGRLLVTVTFLYVCTRYC